ncbi:MAG: type II toxin-antitoxin system RelE/ParE family toxin [Nanoarchaeota archaeon]
MYTLEIKPACKKIINKFCRKNSVLRNAIEKKVAEILANPHHYKPLRYDLSGERRVHIMKSFVLKFEIDTANRAVTLIEFGHHDDAYRR